VVNGKTWPFVNIEPRQYRLRHCQRHRRAFFSSSLLRRQRQRAQIHADRGRCRLPATTHPASHTYPYVRRTCRRDRRLLGLPGQNVVSSNRWCGFVAVQGQCVPSGPHRPHPTLPYEGPVVCQQRIRALRTPARRGPFRSHARNWLPFPTPGRQQAIRFMDAQPPKPPNWVQPKCGISTFQCDAHRSTFMSQVRASRTHKHKPGSTNTFAGETGEWTLRSPTATRFEGQAHFDIGGFRLHCHIIEHENEEMMRPSARGSEHDHTVHTSKVEEVARFA